MINQIIIFRVLYRWLPSLMLVSGVCSICLNQETTRSLKSRLRSANIFYAAFRPGAIDTPGSGWLAEPHKYTFGISGIL
jgi:hypothetical protein